MLIIVGYGAKDSEVNKMILENFNFKIKPTFIIDPFPSDQVKVLQAKINAKLIVKDLNDIEMKDFIR